MTFSTSYTNTITSESASRSDVYTTTFANTSIQADYTSKLTLEVSANSEVTIPLPGINSIISLSISSTNLVQVSLTVDTLNAPVYDGINSLHYSRFFGTGGSLYDHLKIKAGTVNSVVTISVIGNESLPVI
jgi:hypothetical protein